MKKIVLALVVVTGLAFVPATIFAQDVNWDGQYHKGDFSLEVGVGFGYHGVGYGLAVLPGAEWTMADWKIGDVVPLAFGVTAKGFVEFVPGEGLGFGGGGFATFHMGFKGLDIPEFFQKLDWYAGLGAGILVVPWDSPTIGFSLPSYSGLAYYFKDNMAVYLEGIYWYAPGVYGYGGGVVGIRMKK
ncbi:MAG: hypothetical protein JSV89_21670 [Spirochaetaceae bacterium]|nr:MAG: hypothetical protein JSV89_21670 [Spirochaetaceae bacterium]